MCPEFVSYNYDQRDWAPDLKRRADSMRLTDTKNRNDPIAMHTHPLVIPIFWPTKGRWEGQCVYGFVWGVWKSSTGKLTHSIVPQLLLPETPASRNQNPFQDIFSIPNGSRWRVAFWKVRKNVQKRKARTFQTGFVQGLQLGNMLICLFMDTHTHRKIPGWLTHATGWEKRLDRKCFHPTIIGVITT